MRVVSPATATLAVKFLQQKRNLADARALDRDTQTSEDSQMQRQATLYRMILPDHTCPFGVRALELLQEQGFEVDDRILASRDEVDSFKTEHGVATTPQVFIDGDRIGGSDDLERYLSQQSQGA